MRRRGYINLKTDLQKRNHHRYQKISKLLSISKRAPPVWCPLSLTLKPLVIISRILKTIAVKIYCYCISHKRRLFFLFFNLLFQLMDLFRLFKQGAFTFLNSLVKVPVFFYEIMRTLKTVFLIHDQLTRFCIQFGIRMQCFIICFLGRIFAKFT